MDCDIVLRACLGQTMRDMISKNGAFTRSEERVSFHHYSRFLVASDAEQSPTFRKNAGVLTAA